MIVSGSSCTGRGPPLIRRVASLRCLASCPDPHWSLIGVLLTVLRPIVTNTIIPVDFPPYLTLISQACQPRQPVRQDERPRAFPAPPRSEEQLELLGGRGSEQVPARPQPPQGQEVRPQPASETNEILMNHPRALFGPTDHEENLRFVRKELKKAKNEAASKW